MPEDIQACLHAGVLPACYEGTAIDVELQEQSALGCFAREEDDTVTCPMGEVLHKVKAKGKSSVYANKDACRQCKNRCTSSKNHKTVLFGPGVVRVGVKMYGKQEAVVHAPPIGHVFHNSFYRKDHDKKKVLLKIRADKEKLKQRMCSGEHPFGTIKWYDGAHIVSRKREGYGGNWAEFSGIQPETRDQYGGNEEIDRSNGEITPLPFYLPWNCPKTMQKATLKNAKNPLIERVFRQIVAEKATGG